jgi:hypothetical protein
LQHPIQRISHANFLPESQVVVAAGPNVCVWDVEHKACVRLLRTAQTTDIPAVPDMKVFYWRVA